jgi:hypothetical protein
LTRPNSGGFERLAALHPQPSAISKPQPMRQASSRTLTNWAVVIFASRESLDILSRTVKAAQISAQEKAGIDVIVNGNTPLAVALANHLCSQELASEATLIRVWAVAVGDKANAWNQYIQHIWSGEDIAFFIDGYVRLNPDAVRLLGDAVAARANVLGGTGVPSMARTAKAMRAHMSPEGDFHGNFCCIKGATIEQLRQRRIALPFGLYRVDSLMGALLILGLDPAGNAWVTSRIFVHPEASWQTDQKRWWRVDDIRAQIKRVFRQSRGVLENLAVRDHLNVRKQSPESLPATASELVLDWVRRCPKQSSTVLRLNPLTRRALADITQSHVITTDSSPPNLIGSNRASLSHD